MSKKGDFNPASGLPMLPTTETDIDGNPRGLKFEREDWPETDDPMPFEDDLDGFSNDW